MPYRRAQIHVADDVRREREGVHEGLSCDSPRAAMTALIFAKYFSVNAQQVGDNGSIT